jgi:hypothetical protein
MWQDSGETNLAEVTLRRRGGLRAGVVACSRRAESLMNHSPLLDAKLFAQPGQGSVEAVLAWRDVVTLCHRLGLFA